MERLTKRIGEHVYYTKGKYDETIPAECEPHDVRKILQALADYEDTNHTPEECAAAFEELAAYRAAEQDGTLPKLPCKVGDTVYRVIPWCTYRFANCVGCPRATKSGCEIAFFEQDFSVSLCDQIGKTAFLTRPAAEAALKEQEANQ